MRVGERGSVASGSVLDFLPLIAATMRLGRNHGSSLACALETDLNHLHDWSAFVIGKQSICTHVFGDPGRADFRDKGRLL